MVWGLQLPSFTDWFYQGFEGVNDLEAVMCFHSPTVRPSYSWARLHGAVGCWDLASSVYCMNRKNTLSPKACRDQWYTTNNFSSDSPLRKFNLDWALAAWLMTIDVILLWMGKKKSGRNMGVMDSRGCEPSEGLCRLWRKPVLVLSQSGAGSQVTFCLHSTGSHPPEITVLALTLRQLSYPSQSGAGNQVTLCLHSTGSHSPEITVLALKLRQPSYPFRCLFLSTTDDYRVPSSSPISSFSCIRWS